MSFEGQRRVGGCGRENEPLAPKFQPIQLPHFEFLVLSHRDEVLEFCVDCREADWARFQKVYHSFLIEIRRRSPEFPGSKFKLGEATSVRC